MLELREALSYSSGVGWGDWYRGLPNLLTEEFSFFEGDEEVARARIYPEYRLHVPYVGLQRGRFVDIDRLVVRDGRRGRGIGLDALELLVRRYQGQQMIAFSAADHFWAKAGWTRAIRRDGDPFAMTLFYNRFK